MSARVGLRFFAHTSRQSALRTPFRTSRETVFRRYQTTATNPATEASQPQSLFQRLWTSEIGIKTVHFWAPIMKWGVVLAGATDFLRPAEKLSLTQNIALMATGAIWTRWCFVIKPKNVLLAAVNFSLFTVGTIQVSRIFMYQQEQKGSASAAFKALVEDLTHKAQSAEEKALKEIA